MQIDYADKDVAVQNANAMLNNYVIQADRSFFRSVSVIDRIPVELSCEGDCTFYINTTEKPLSVLDRDGVVRILKPQRETLMDRFHESDLRRLYPDSLLIIKSVVHDLSAIDSDVSLTNDPNRALDEIETLKNIHRPISDFERCYTSVNRAFRKAMVDHQNLLRERTNGTGITNFEAPGRFVTAICQVININEMMPEMGNYIEAADIVVRIERYDPTLDRRNRIIPNPKALIHPFSLVGLSYNAEGGLSAFDPNVNFRMIRVIRKERKTSDTSMYVVNFNKVVKIPIQTGKPGEQDGIYITERNDEGMLRETRYPFEEGPNLGIFEYFAEATGEQQGIARKYINEELQRRIAELEEEKKEMERKEQQRKNDAARRSDVIKLVAQGVAAAAAIIGAILTLVKLFSPAKLFGSLA